MSFNYLRILVTVRSCYTSLSLKIIVIKLFSAYSPLFACWHIHKILSLILYVYKLHLLKHLFFSFSCFFLFTFVLFLLLLCVFDFFALFLSLPISVFALILRHVPSDSTLPPLPPCPLSPSSPFSGARHNKRRWGFHMVFFATRAIFPLLIYMIFFKLSFYVII